jgi:hypothetical protein
MIIDNEVHCIYRRGTGIVSNCLNGLLQQVLVYTAAIILTICFCEVEIFLLLEELPQKIISYFIIE